MSAVRKSAMWLLVCLLAAGVSIGAALVGLGVPPWALAPVAGIVSLVAIIVASVIGVKAGRS